MEIKERKKRNKGKIIITIFLIVSILTLMKYTFKNAYAYYGTNTYLPIINTSIGNFASSKWNEELPDKAKTADITTQIYLQNQRDEEEYNLVNYIPVLGYVYDEENSSCIPKEATLKSNIEIVDGKVKYQIKNETAKQIICRIYYKVDSTSDITLYALVRDNNYGTKEYSGNKYRFLKGMPESSYHYEGYECNNKGVVTTITYTNNKFKTVTKGPNTCYAYFSK